MLSKSAGSVDIIQVDVLDVVYSNVPSVYRISREYNFFVMTIVMSLHPHEHVLEERA